MHKLPILSLSQKTYSELVFEKLGKGKELAALLYESWMRKKALPFDHTAFKNAQKLLEQMIEMTDFCLPEVCGHESDGATVKFLVHLQGGGEVESVVIPMQSGGTLCVSSQVGCKMGCSFCETGRMGLLKSLKAEEITAQLFIARHILKQSIKNVVFMGMGEPFDNYDEVMKAVKVMMEPLGFGLGRKQITISTSGLVEKIYQMMNEPFETPNLAVSVTAATDILRNKLMPVNKKHGLQELKEAMRAYNQKTNRWILAACTLMRGVNDSIENALELADFLTGLDVKVNLIAYNSQVKSRYERPDDETIERFAAVLREKGYYTLMRQTKGRSIMAACGQLTTKQRKLPLSQ